MSYLTALEDSLLSIIFLLLPLNGLTRANLFKFNISYFKVIVLVHHNISNHAYSCVSFPTTASTRPNLPTLVRVVLVSLYLKMIHANMRYYLRFAALVS